MVDQSRPRKPRHGRAGCADIVAVQPGHRDRRPVGDTELAGVVYNQRIGNKFTFRLGPAIGETDSELDPGTPEQPGKAPSRLAPTKVPLPSICMDDLRLYLQGDHATAERLRLPLLVVVDEAQYVKNPEAQRSRRTAALVAGVDRAILLTGTPMQNHVGEFRTLVSYLHDVSPLIPGLSFANATIELNGPSGGVAKSGVPQKSTW